jgi:cellulose synthase/poly-beta-1,6-N-acetylglucosamine synthase-like glycosyltransferase
LALADARVPTDESCGSCVEIQRRFGQITPMKISVVVPAFNEERLLGETLAQIRTAAEVFVGRGWDWELIVCDNNSTDRTAEIAREAGVTVVFEPVNQIARARNSGAAAATGDWLVFVDADSHPGVELFADMAKEIQSGSCFAGGATICWDRKNFLTALMMPILNVGFRWRRFLHGPFMFIESATFRKLGGFSLETFCGEDWELGQRLQKLAKETGRRFVILHRHPILTSARQLKEHSPLASFKMLYYILFVPRRIKTSREKARRWYNERR